MADRKLIIEVSEVLLLESSAPDSQKEKGRMTTEMGNKVNKSVKKVRSPKLQKFCSSRATLSTHADSFAKV